MRGDAGSLGAEWFFGDLNQNFLALLQELLNRRQGRVLRVCVIAWAVVVVAPLDIMLNRFNFIKHVSDIEKGRFFETDIDKGRLHAGQNPGNFAEINIADNSFFPVSFNIELSYMIVLN